MCCPVPGTIFVADTGNHRVMRWRDGARAGVALASGCCLGSPNRDILVVVVDGGDDDDFHDHGDGGDHDKDSDGSSGDSGG